MPTSPDSSSTPRPAMPPIVYVPTTDEADPASRRLVMHQVPDGRTALYTYSAPDRLDAFYSPRHPWVLMDVASLQQAHEQAPYDLLFVDINPGLRPDLDSEAET